MTRFDFFFGPQCSGKTTLASELFKSYQYISLGNLVRSSDNSSVEKKLANSLISKAQIWPPWLGLSFIEKDLLKALSSQKDVLIDGYPRNIDEFNFLRQFIFDNNLPNFTSIIEVTADKDVLVERYKKRKSKRGENVDFFNLRFNQYLNLKEFLRSFSEENKIKYYKIDTS